MTVLTKAHSTVPPRARAGLVLPGLGHLLVGDWVHGAGLLALDGLLVLAAVSGTSHVPAWWAPGPGGGLSVDDVLALVTWPALAVSLWFVAYRRAFPRPLSHAARTSNWLVFRRALVRHRAGMMGFYGVVFMLLLTLLAPLVAPFDPNAVFVGDKNLPPDSVFWFGTDRFGRDVFSRLVVGGRLSLMVGVVAVSIATTVGTTVGAVAAFAGGRVDRLLMFLTDGLIALPKLVLLLTIVGMFRVQGPAGLFLIIAILGATGWMGVARIVRGQVLSLREQDFVHAARALGLPSSRIVFRHILPNAMAPVIVYCSLATGGAMMAEASLSFLGLGMPPPTATWGVMVADGKVALRFAPHIAVFPGLAIMMAVLSFNLLGDGLRDAFDPKLRGYKSSKR